MSRQLNLRVSEAYARTLERVAKRTGRPVAAVLEAVGTPALEAWEAYQLAGETVDAPALDALFTSARTRVRASARRRPR